MDDALLLELVRTTARVSGALFVAGLVAAALRPAWRTRLFAAFAVAHGVHFAFVAAWVLRLKDAAGGVPPEGAHGDVVKLVVYVAAGAALVGASARGKAVVQHVAVALFAIGFVVGWAGRVTAERPWGAVGIAALVVALVLYVRASARSTRSALASRRAIP